MRLNLPATIGAGDRIGVVAPASPFDRERFSLGIRVLRDLGFDPVCAPNLFSRNGYLAGPAARRAADIHGFFADPEIKAVWCARGGYGSMPLLRELDFAHLARNPKIFIGCSDITALLVNLYSRCRMPAFHGPMIASLADADDASTDGLMQALASSRPLRIAMPGGRVIRPGRAAGPVIGGNLATLCHLLATPYAPDFSGCILFLEDVGEKPYRVDRMLTQMRLAGCFDQIAGLMAGSFVRCGPESEIERVFADIFADSRFPVVTGFPAGHGWPNMTVPLGLRAELDSRSRSLSYTEAAVRGPEPAGEL